MITLSPITLLVIIVVAAVCGAALVLFWLASEFRDDEPRL